MIYILFFFCFFCCLFFFCVLWFLLLFALESISLFVCFHWIKRCTHDVEQRMKKLKLDDWITMQRRRKWRWAQKLALTDHFDWTTAALRWDPSLDSQLKSRRRPGRPRTRWTDDICGYLRQQTRPNTTDNTNDDYNTIGDDDVHTNDDDAHDDDDDERHRDESDGDNRQAQLMDNLFWLDMAREQHLWSRLEDGYVKR